MLQNTYASERRITSLEEELGRTRRERDKALAALEEVRTGLRHEKDLVKNLKSSLQRMDDLRDCERERVTDLQREMDDMVIRYQVALQEAATMAVDEYKASEEFTRLVHGSGTGGLYAEVPSATPQINSPGLFPPYAVDDFDVDAPLAASENGVEAGDIVRSG